MNHDSHTFFRADKLSDARLALSIHFTTDEVRPSNEDGVDGRGMAFGLVRGAGAFAAVLPSFALVSRMPFAQHNHGFGHSFSATSSSRREATVGGALARVSAFRVGLGVAGAVIAPGLRACPSRSCDGWVCGLGAVGASFVFGLARGAGAFVVVLPTFALLSRMRLAQHNRGFGHFFSAASSL